MKQGDVWKKVKDAFTERWPNGHMERVENLLGRGMPDVTWCTGLSIDGRLVEEWIDPARGVGEWIEPARRMEGWIEIKTGYQKLTPLQRDWISRRRAAGGRAVVLTIRSNKALIELKEEGKVIVIEPLDWAYIIRLITY